MAFFAQHSFKNIGHYERGPDGTVKMVKSVKKLTHRCHLVYAMFSETGECYYVGMTTQGYSRPLGYHRNAIMATVRDGIIREMAKNRKVLVFAKEDNLVVHHENLEIVVGEAIEKALIKKYSPPWNKHRPR